MKKYLKICTIDLLSLILLPIVATILMFIFSEYFDGKYGFFRFNFIENIYSPYAFFFNSLIILIIWIMNIAFLIPKINKKYFIIIMIQAFIVVGYLFVYNVIDFINHSGFRILGYVIFNLSFSILFILKYNIIKACSNADDVIVLSNRPNRNPF